MTIQLRSMLRTIPKAALFLGCLFSTVALKTAHGQELVGQTIHDLAAYGYVLMDDINTPLLHHVGTGAPYDLRVLAESTDNMDPDSPSSRTRSKANSRDEFQRAEAAAEWGSFIHERIQMLKNARGYVIMLRASWGEYDFANNRLPVKLRMVRQAANSNSSFHCFGAYGLSKHRYGQDLRTACLTAPNLNANAPFLQYFPIQDISLARAIRQSAPNYKIYALAEPAGKYQLTRGREIQYMPLETYVASGIQPVKITGLVLTTFNGRKIVAVSSVSSDPLGAAASQGKAATGTTNEAAAPAQRAAVTAPEAVGGWKMVARNGGTTFYADPSSIKRDGGVVLVRQMLDLSEADANGRRSFVEIFSYNCNKRTSRLVSMKGYNQSMGQGGVLSELAIPEDFGQVGSGTVTEAMFNFACNAPAPKN